MQSGRGRWRCPTVLSSCTRKVVQVGTAYDVYRRPVEHAFVADFVGKANLLPASVVGVFSDRLDLEVLGRPLSVPSANECVLRPGESATLLVRPEAILLLERGGGAIQVVSAALPPALWWSMMLTWLTWRSA